MIQIEPTEEDDSPIAWLQERLRRLELAPSPTGRAAIARRRFAELILERIREDVRDEAEAREELRVLFGRPPK